MLMVLQASFEPQPSQTLTSMTENTAGAIKADTHA